MKMKPEHYEHLRDAVARVVADQAARCSHGCVSLMLDAIRSKLRLDSRVKDVEKRIRWDAFYAARLACWASDNLHYLDDTHIDTALRRIMEEVERPVVVTL